MVYASYFKYIILCDCMCYHGIATMFRLKDILPLIATTAKFLKLTGPVIMPTPVAHQSSSIKFVIVQNNEYVS